MYRADQEALCAALRQAELKIEQQDRQREALEERIDQLTVAASLPNRHRSLLNVALAVALFACAMAIYFRVRSDRAAAQLEEISLRDQMLVASTAQLKQNLTERNRALGRCRSAAGQAYASSGPDWVHQGMTAAYPALTACLARTAQRESILLSVVLERGFGKVYPEHAALVTPSVSRGVTSCLLDALALTPFQPPVGKRHFVYALYPPQRLALR
ncbi:MAG: hypothetical protein H6707_09315 [Deltaproteobacteria bacterium]|nr:hypothetical protein [Deltaproteobacteria bacterium]